MHEHDATNILVNTDNSHHVSGSADDEGGLGDGNRSTATPIDIENMREK